MQTYIIDIRPRRQATFPRKLLEELGLKEGDKLEAFVKDKKIILKSKKQISMDAFKAIQKAIQESGIPESEFQDNLVKIRKQIYEERYTKNLS